MESTDKRGYVQFMKYPGYQVLRKKFCEPGAHLNRRWIRYQGIPLSGQGVTVHTLLYARMAAVSR